MPVPQLIDESFNRITPLLPNKLFHTTTQRHNVALSLV